MNNIVYLFNIYPVSAWIEYAIAYTVIILTIIICGLIYKAIYKKW